MDHSELLERCEAWHEAGDYRKIVEALEAIPEEERTTDIDMELARAYNNLGNSGDIEGRRLLKKALGLMEPHESELSDDYSWNFRMGYSLFYLEREGEALPRFEKALELHPGDDPKYNSVEDIQEFIEYCKDAMALPRFEMTFKTRVARAWEEFSKEEADIRRMMDSDRRDDYSEELIRRIQDVLEIALDDPTFEFGIDEGKHDLVLVTQGDKTRLFEYVYFRDHAPESVLENWKITVGRPPRPEFHLRVFDLDVCGDDVDVWVERTEEDRISLKVHCDKVQGSMEDEDKVWWMLFTVVDNFIGEVANMRQVESFEVVDDLPEGQPIRLSDLPKAIEDLGIVLTNDADSYLKRYTVYKTEPNRESDGPWRFDIISGSNCCPPIVNDYYSGERRYVNTLHADGAVAGYIAYSLDTFDGDDRSDRIFDFRDSLEEALTDKAGENSFTVIGGATGLYYGYLDLIAWDLSSVLPAAQEFLTDSGVSEAFFRVFAMDVPTCLIANNKDGDADLDLDDIDYIPYDPEDPEPFYDQITKWNEEGEYSRCIAVLETIPEELRDYRSEYTLVRVLQNYAIIGDHDEGTPGYKSDRALRRSLEILESIRDEGENRAEWNMRMAYGHQYLEGQEELAIPYAERWSELDPEDEDAKGVIRECLEEIAARENGSECEEDGEGDETGVFAGFVLMLRASWSKMQLVRDLREMWGIEAEEDDDESDDDSLVFEVDGRVAAVSLMKGPIPDGEAEANAENNYMWSEAVEIAKEHRAHLLVFVGKKDDDDLIERGKLFVKILAACCRQENATGVYTSGVVFQPGFYEAMAEMMNDDELPIFNWIWFGLYRTEDGISGYTYGMRTFGREEVEVLDAEAEPDEVRDLLVNIVSYQLECDVHLKDGETIGFSENDRHTISLSGGVALPGMTLKVSYSAAEIWMDDAECHLESIHEKSLPVDEIAAYNHMAIYLRWCVEHGLMGEDFMEKYGEQVAGNDLRPFIRDVLGGRMDASMFNSDGWGFARYYYNYCGELDYPHYPSDIDDYALRYFGPERYNSDEFKTEAYLFIPFDESYYNDMAEVIGRRYANWKNQEIDPKTKEPSELARALMEYLGCECEYFPSMRDDDPIMSAYGYARRLGVREGYIPVLVKVDDILWECLILNSDPDSDGEDSYAFDPKKVREYRERILSAQLKDGKEVLESLVGLRRAEAEDDDLDWDEDVVGIMEGGEERDRLASYWNYETQMTDPMILAKIPAEYPWEVFAWLPFGNWNECPDTPDMMSVAKHWFESFGAVPAAITHDELEFVLPEPIPDDEAIDVAIDQYGLCPDMDQNHGTMGHLADELRQSTVWYFWWD